MTENLETDANPFELAEEQLNDIKEQFRLLNAMREKVFEDLCKGDEYLHIILTDHYHFNAYDNRKSEGFFDKNPIEFEGISFYPVSADAGSVYCVGTKDGEMYSIRCSDWSEELGTWEPDCEVYKMTEGDIELFREGGYYVGC